VIKGEWHYLEHDWVAREGGFVYEPPGEIHTLVVPAHCPEMITFFNISGAMIYVDDAGRQAGYEDVFTKIDMCRAHSSPSARPATSTSSSADRQRPGTAAGRSRPYVCRWSGDSSPSGSAPLGAWLRWGLSAAHPVAALPLGTLTTSLVGGYLIGLAVGFFWRHDLPGGADVRRHRVLGGLTTFRPSSEVTQLLLRGEYWTGFGLASTHLLGSLLLTLGGIATWRAFVA
jgi:fluoride ion exporter CrcB/FEX